MLDEFRKIKEVYYKNCIPSSSNLTCQTTVDDLNDNGYSIIKSFFSSEQIAQIMDDLIKEKIIDSHNFFLKNNSLPYYLGTYSLRNPEFQSCVSFFKHPILKGISKSYISRDAQPLRSHFLFLVDKNHENVNLWHFDDWRHRLKFFLLLEDVTEDHAPIEILAKTHHGTWREEKEFQYFKYYKRGHNLEYTNEIAQHCGCFLNTEVAELKEKYHFEPILCTGNAGDLVVLDTRAIHRRRILKSDQRIFLFQSYANYEGVHV